MSAFTADGFKLTIKSVNTRQTKIKLPIAVLIGSLILLTILMSLTSPVSSIVWTIFFFVLLLILLMACAASLIVLQKGNLTPKTRHRIVLVSSFLVVCLMLRSAGSLNPVDTLVLGLIFVGFVFYFSRRP